MPPRRAQEGGRKVTVCGKVAPAIAEALEAIAEQMSIDSAPATVTLSQLVEHALNEYVAKHPPRKQKPRH